MKIAVDIDNTITKAPSLFKEFMKLPAECFLLTGNQDERGNLEYRKEQLKHLGFEEYWLTKLIICSGNSKDEIGIKKAEFCRDNSIDFFIDDMDLYHKKVKEISPNTIRLKIL